VCTVCTVTVALYSDSVGTDCVPYVQLLLYCTVTVWGQIVCTVRTVTAVLYSYCVGTDCVYSMYSYCSIVEGLCGDIQECLQLEIREKENTK
jgi:hypothetical protein